MCGRMVNLTSFEAMIGLFQATPANDLPEVPNFNVCPTNAVAVVTSDQGARRLRPMRWGFLPQWYKTPTDGPLLINARSETLADKPAFRAACRQRRCLIVADGFYEWTKDDQGQRLPWYIYPAEGGPLAFAGLWQDWHREGEELTTCAIVTCAAGPGMAQLHHREPVTLAPADWPLWLGEAGHGAAPLMRAAPDGRLTWHRVATEVNSNRAAGPHLIEAI